ncbi:hypothetical protein [Micromonospora endophytica]|uniref:hypothetical protein n=1 Tax=Micromonospora endophytica TaxID=515350 RepID=UPI0021ACF80F|nr:hypothetical protein [Micromonospora endophytica]
MNSAFTLRAALALTGIRLAELLARPDARGRVEARAATVARRRGGASGPVEEALLDLRLDPYRADPAQPDVYFEVLDWEAAVLVSLSQYQSRSDDPETGLFAWVAAERSPASKVLAIASTLALAECGDGEVIDEYGYLSDLRMNAPVELFGRLRLPMGQRSLEAAIDGVLARTRLRRTPMVNDG